MKRSLLKRRTRLRPVSAKRAKDNRIYSQKRKDFLAAHPWCQIWLKRHGKDESDVKVYGDFGYVNFYEFAPNFTNAWQKCVPRSSEIHHTKKPRCKYLNDESTWLAASREQHDWVENNKSEARKLGLLK